MVLIGLIIIGGLNARDARTPSSAWGFTGTDVDAAGDRAHTKLTGAGQQQHQPAGNRREGRQ